MSTNAHSLTQDINQSYAQQPARGTLVLQRLLPGTPERIWAYLTEADKLKLWLADAKMGREPGASVELSFDHHGLTPHTEEIPDRYKDGSCALVTGKILRYEPHSALAYGWGWGHGASEVLFELKPQGEQTLLTVTHSKIGSRESMISIAGGWHTHLGILLDKLQGRAPQPFLENPRRARS